MDHRATKYLVLLVASSLLGQGLVREGKPVVVEGVSEVWRLVWEGVPTPVCGPEGDEWMTGVIDWT